MDLFKEAASPPTPEFWAFEKAQPLFCGGLRKIPPSQSSSNWPEPKKDWIPQAPPCWPAKSSLPISIRTSGVKKLTSGAFPGRTARLPNEVHSACLILDQETSLLL